MIILVLTGIVGIFEKWAPRWLAVGVAGVLSQCFLTLWVLDAMLYWVYRYHFNGLVLWVLRSEAGRASIGITEEVKVIFFGIMVVLFVFIVSLFWRMGKRKWLPGFPRIVWALAALIVIEKMSYAILDVYGQRSSFSVGSQALPGYFKITIKKWYGRTFGIERLALAEPQTQHPRQSRFSPEQFRLRNGVKTLSVMILVIDSWRSDIATEEVMPELSRLRKNALDFTNHYSGGNGTRDGVFSLMTGTHSIRWFDVLASPEPSPLLTLYRQLDARIGMWSSTSLEFPEFRRTIFSGLGEKYYFDRPEGDSQHVRDQHVVSQLTQSLREGHVGERRFDFVLLDSAHGPFGFRPEDAVFKPFAKSYFTPDLFSRDTVVPIINRYRNANRFLDGQIAAIFTALKASGRDRDTVVVLTGDHGEEFYDYGYWGHTSAFSESQLRVPLMIFHPTRRGRVFEHVTQHVDVMATVLPWLGVTDPVSSYSQGISLFDTNRRILTACGWERCSLSDGKIRLVFGASSVGISEFEVLDRNYRPLDGEPPGVNELIARALDLR